MHGKEGVQYRRVKKLAEQNQKNKNQASYKSNYIRELAGNPIEAEQLVLNNKSSPSTTTNNHMIAYMKNHKNTVAPRFFPCSVQKNRKHSI